MGDCTVIDTATFKATIGQNRYAEWVAKDITVRGDSAAEIAERLEDAVTAVTLRLQRLNKK